MLPASTKTSLFIRYAMAVALYLTAVVIMISFATLLLPGANDNNQCNSISCQSGQVKGVFLAQAGGHGTGCGCYDKPICGNKILEINEECDEGNTGGPTCTETCHCRLGYNPIGNTSCSLTCGDAFVTGGEYCDCGNGAVGHDYRYAQGNPFTCVAPNVTGDAPYHLSEVDYCNNACNTKLTRYCGDGIKDPEEECDNSNFGGKGCGNYGFDANLGHLNCTADCRISTVDCTNCGNSIIDSGEECDKGNFGSQTCVSRKGSSLYSGPLICTSDCHIDDSGCQLNCGNGQLDLDEDCDPTAPEAEYKIGCISDCTCDGSKGFFAYYTQGFSAYLNQPFHLIPKRGCGCWEPWGQILNTDNTQCVCPDGFQTVDTWFGIPGLYSCEIFAAPDNDYNNKCKDLYGADAYFSIDENYRVLAYQPTISQTEQVERDYFIVNNPGNITLPDSVYGIGIHLKKLFGLYVDVQVHGNLDDQGISLEVNGKSSNFSWMNEPAAFRSSDNCIFRYGSEWNTIGGKDIFSEGAFVSPNKRDCFGQFGDYGRITFVPQDGIEYGAFPKTVKVDFKHPDNDVTVKMIFHYIGCYVPEERANITMKTNTGFVFTVLNVLENAVNFVIASYNNVVSAIVSFLK